MSAAYLDTSALVKLVVTESETAALRRWLNDRPDRRVATSALARTELVRAVARADGSLVAHARRLLSAISEVAVDRVTLDHAALISLSSVRSLDAIHLASALSLGADVDVVVTYDERMREAADLVGLATAAPS